VPTAVVEIARRLEDAGYETWCVGGAVRDAWLGRARADWDLATRARPEEVRRLFRRTYPIGIPFGTVGVRGRDGRVYEVTSFRRDVATDGRHAVIAYADTLDEDLARRDFTINAIAYHPLRHEWRDPFGGRHDLEARVLRAVGDPATRFAEDYLRVLRGLRFAGRYGLEIEPATWAAMRAAAPRCTVLSGERVREELLKVMADPRPSRALDLYRRASVLASLYPEMAVSDEAWPVLLRAVDALGRHHPFLRAVAWFHGVPSPDALEAMMRRLRFSNAETARARHLVGALRRPLPEPGDGPGIRRWLHAVGRDAVRDVLRLHGAFARARGIPDERRAVARAVRAVRAEWSRRPPLTLAELAIDGNDLKAMGLVPGPRFAEILDDCLARVLEDPEMNTPERLRDYVARRWANAR
jgi:tRNA nucleotidyltransferase (CCA-adding enzyme)